MIDPSIRCENILQAPTRTLAAYSHSAVRALSAAVALVVCAALLAADEPERSAQSVASTSPVGVPGQAGPPAPALERLSGPEPAAIVDLQRQVNELRSDLLDERERRIGRLQEANGAVLAVLALVIGVGGLWVYAKFRAIASEARIGAAAARALANAEPNLMPKPWPLPAESGVTPHPLPRLLRASVGLDTGLAPALGVANGSPAAPWASNGLRASHGPVKEPELGSGAASPQRPDHGTPDPDRGGEDAEVQRCEEVVADCTEALRRAPDDPRLYLERGNALSGLQRYEAAVADYDRAILLDPDNAAVYLARCQARSELGLHDQALEDYERIVRLDPDLAGSAVQE